MPSFIKHTGVQTGTNTRLCVVFMQLPDDKKHALVVYSDSLPDKYHDDFMSAVESKEGQAAKELYEVLSRKVFWNGNVMLDSLHKEGMLKKLPTDSITMTPNSATSIPLTDLLKQMEEITGGEAGNTPVKPPQSLSENITEQIDMTAEGDKKQIAPKLVSPSSDVGRRSRKKTCRSSKI